MNQFKMEKKPIKTLKIRLFSPRVLCSTKEHQITIQIKINRHIEEEEDRISKPQIHGSYI